MSPERRARSLAAVALAVSAVPWFGSALTGRSLLYFRDLIQNLYPWRRFWAGEIHQGRWPLWDPYAASGSPFLANLNNLSCYPLAWLQAILPFDLAFNWMLVLTWILAQAGAYRLARRLGAARPAAVVGALAFGGSGYMVSALNLANVLVAAAAAPWMAWAAAGIARRAGARDAAVLAAATALCLLGGEPLALGVALAGSALVVALWQRQRGAPQARRWKAALAGAGMGLLLAAPAVLPAAEMVHRSERGEGLVEGERTRWSLTGLGMAEFLVPRLEGDPTSFDPGRYWGQGAQGAALPLLLSLYAGVPLLTLAACGWARLPRGARILTAGALALCLGLAAGPALPLYAALESAGPAARWVRYPSKLLLGVFLPVCVLAALGLERLRRGEPPGRALRRLPFAVAALFALALAAELTGRGWLEGWAHLEFGLPAETARAAARSLRGSLAAGLVLAAASGALLGPLRRRLRPLAGSAAWMVLVAGDLWCAQAALVPRAPAAAFRLRPVFASYLQPGDRIYREERPNGFRLRAPGPSRMWGYLWDRATLARGAASEARLVSVLERPTDRLWPATTARVRRWAIEAEPAARARLLRRFGVRWWLTYDPLSVPGTEETGAALDASDPPLRLLRILEPLPRVAWAERFEAAADEDSLRRGLLGQGADFWVEGAGAAPPAPTPIESSAGRCSVVEEGTHFMELRCEAERPGLAVVLDGWYAGWEVRVDGVRFDVLRVNGAYRGVQVPAGRHALVWRFRPLSLQLGRALGLLGLAGVAVAGSRRPPRAAAAASPL